MPGKGGLLVTGQLGEVMQESARAGLSYIRSRAAALGLPDDFPSNLDIHIHLPEGAIPKDGPSAGITMATAIISALTRRPVRSDLAMTGEITLRGRVLPIGGLKEKALAAHRVGIKHLLVPAENEKDLAEIPAKIRGEMHITLVESMDEVVQQALLPPEASVKGADESAPTDSAGRIPIPPAPVVVSVEEHQVVPPTADPGEQPTA
jgi:ATP-dependent Lon protease